MGTNITVEDMEFVRWLDSKEADQFWDRDENGQTIILRLGWEKPEKSIIE